MTGQTSMFTQEPAPDVTLCWLWLANAVGYASQRAGRVLDAFGGAREAWEARGSDEFAQAAGQQASRRARGTDPEDFEGLLKVCRDTGVRILAYDDADYPLALTRVPDMPLVLYCTGDPAWLNEPAAVGMVGSRTPTEYGRQAADSIGTGLARAGAVIVSGLADGLDSAAHRAAVKAGRPTVGVLGVPIDRTYPAANAQLRGEIEKNGCVISEYPPHTEPIGRNGFLQRNRLIAALSSALVVVEAREKSGTMSTVAHAERYSRPVFAVPGSIFAENSAGTNRLLQSGRAKAVCRAEDLFPLLGLKEPRGGSRPKPPEPPEPMSEAERRVMACLGAQPRGIEELSALSGVPTAALLGTLMRLELSGRVLCRPGKRYMLR